MGLTLTTLGELLIGYSILKVHARLGMEHRVDRKVVAEIKKEKWITMTGMALIVVGFVIQMLYSS